jgi:hypothetical protein
MVLIYKMLVENMVNLANFTIIGATFSDKATHYEKYLTKLRRHAILELDQFCGSSTG